MSSLPNEIKIPTAVLAPGTEAALEQCSQFVVKRIEDAVTQELYGQWLVALSNTEKQIHADLDGLCQTLDKAHKEATGLRGQKLAKVKAVKDAIALELGAYAGRLEDLRREAQEKLDREARENEKRQAENDAIALAEDLAFEGREEEAEAVIDRAASSAIAPVRAVAPAPPKLSGVAVRQGALNYEISEPKLVKHEYCSPDRKKIKAAVLAHGAEAAAMVGGIRIYREASKAVSTGRR